MGRGKSNEEYEILLTKLQIETFDSTSIMMIFGYILTDLLHELLSYKYTARSLYGKQINATYRNNE